VPLVEVDGLVRLFGVRPRRRGVFGAVADLFGGERSEVRALDGVSFALEAGEAVGYLGPNGAGKSTTVKCLAGILEPTAGAVRVAGLDPWRDRRAHVRNIGVVFGQRTQLWWDLAVQEAYDLLASVFAVPTATYQRRLARLDELLELSPLLRTPVRQLSLGQRVRCDLAAALLHGPRVLLLDEPTIGLDVAVRLRIRRFLRALVDAEEVALLLTTHDLGDIEQICERVVLLDEGRVAFDGPLADLRARVGMGRVLVVEAAGPLADADLGALSRELPGSVSRRSERTFEVHLGPDVPAGRVMQEVVARMEVRDIAIAEPSTEEVVAAIYEGEG
jgi:ABC-2 type transport system ATP-binding protein